MGFEGVIVALALTLALVKFLTLLGFNLIQDMLDLLRKFGLYVDKCGRS